MKQALTYGSSSLTVALGTFVQESLEDISVWLLTMLCIIMADLASGIWKIYKTGGKIRVTKGLRDTMGKLVVYFAFVVAAVFLGQASGLENIAKYCCLAVIGGEGVSIFGNLLQAHGYDIDMHVLIQWIQGKFGISGTDIIVPKNEEVKEENK